MKIIHKQRNFKEIPLIFKDIFTNIKGNGENMIQYFSFTFLFVMLQQLLQDFNSNGTTQNIDFNNISQNPIDMSLTTMIFHMGESLLTVILFSIPALSFLFFRKTKTSMKNKIMEVFSLKMYLNIFLSLSIFFLFILLMFYFALPQELTSWNVIQSEQEREIALKSLTEWDKTFAVTVILTGLSLIPYLFITTITNYMNYLNFNYGVFRGYFVTLYYIFKNTFFIYIPFTIILLSMSFLSINLSDLIENNLLMIVLKSFIFSIWGYLFFIIYKNLFEIIEIEDTDEKENKDRIINKYK